MLESDEPEPIQFDDPNQIEELGESVNPDDEPLYRFSWRRFFVVGTAILTLPIWAPWVKEHSGMQLLLVAPFILIFVVSLVYVAVMFPSKAVRKRNRRRK